jgi:hypothetical protein
MFKLRKIGYKYNIGRKLLEGEFDNEGQDQK